MQNTAIAGRLILTVPVATAIATVLLLGANRAGSDETSREWERFLQPSSVVSSGGSHTILEFSDFQCAYCARVQATLRLLQERHPGEIRILFRHNPLPRHVHAVAAAEASECANEQGRFAQYHKLLFDKQDSIGIKTWGSFAREAGVPDLERYGDCVDNRRYAERITEDIAAAAEAGFFGTPAFIVDGRRITGSRPLSDFEQLLD